MAGLQYTDMIYYFQPPYLSYYQLASKVWQKNIILELFKLPNKHGFIFYIEECKNVKNGK